MRTLDIQLNLTSETVQQAAVVEPLAVEPNTPIRDVLTLLKERGIGSTLICQEGVLKGIFTERDALRVMAAGSDLDASIESVMTADPVTLRPTDTMAKAIKTMSSGGYRRLPIVDDAMRPVGIIKVSGIVHYLVDHFPEAVYNLPPDPHQVMPEREGA